LEFQSCLTYYEQQHQEITAKCLKEEKLSIFFEAFSSKSLIFKMFKVMCSSQKIHLKNEKCKIINSWMPQFTNFVCMHFYISNFAGSFYSCKKKEHDSSLSLKYIFVALLKAIIACIWIESLIKTGTSSFPFLFTSRDCWFISARDGRMSKVSG
jgi:hypothetical protein